MSRSTTTTGLPVLQESQAHSLDRREFCTFAAACALITAVGCGADDPMTGPPDDDAGGAGPDAALAPDGAVEADAAPPAGSCTMPADYADCGPMSQFQPDKAVFFQELNLFVVRDAGGLYALSARCTHQGFPLTPQTGRFHCNRHMSNFTLNGEVINGPAQVALNHFDVCILPGGNLGVKNTVVVDPSTRLEI